MFNSWIVAGLATGRAAGTVMRDVGPGVEAVPQKARVVNRTIAAAVGSRTMPKFLQICASQDDLFALDEEGDVYQYNFNTKTWLKLEGGRSPEGMT